MTRIAVTGHRALPAHVEALIDRAIRAELARFASTDLVGISCLADGADQVFARAVLDRGGTLEAVVPATAYRDGLPEQARSGYDELLAKATAVQRLDFNESTATSQMAASVRMLERADLLLAVWDGQPARGYGGTADVVDHARRVGLPVTVVWPAGASRE